MKYLAAAVTLFALGPITSQAKEKPMSFHELSAKTIDLKQQPLSAYKGKVVLVVNTASECGYTPQYADLEKLHQELQGQGLRGARLPLQRLRRPGAGQRGGDQEVLQPASTR